MGPTPWAAGVAAGDCWRSFSGTVGDVVPEPDDLCVASCLTAGIATLHVIARVRLATVFRPRAQQDRGGDLVGLIRFRRRQIRRHGCCDRTPVQFDAAKWA